MASLGHTELIKLSPNLNPSDAKVIIFMANQTNTMANGGQAPCKTRSSADMLLTMKDGY